MTLDYILDKWELRGKQSPITMACSRKATLPKIFRKCGFSVGAEIGVERGIYSKKLCELIPNLKLYGVDPWETYEGYRDHVNQERLDLFYIETKERMKGFNYQIVRARSMEAVKWFADGSLDFVFIDAAHDYESVKEDIREWHKKVKKDGIVAGHDYMNGNHSGMDKIVTAYGVKEAVNEWVREQGIEHLFILRKDKSPSWFYVK